MQVELKPCPFCGGEAVLQKFNVSIPGRIICACSAEMRGYRGQPLSELIAAWNSRAERTCRNVCKEWVKTSFAGAETSFCCSECGAHYVDCESYYAGLADADEEQIRTNYCPNCGARVVGE